MTLLTVQSAARILGVSRRTVERDALRELLVDAKLCLQDMGESTQRMMIARIDAALAGKSDPTAAQPDLR